MDAFSAVDVDFSGDLDVNEWIQLFTSLDSSISPHQARMIFMQINKSGDGYLTSKDLVPIIFNRANKDQLSLIQVTIYCSTFATLVSVLSLLLYVCTFVLLKYLIRPMCNQKLFKSAMMNTV